MRKFVLSSLCVLLSPAVFAQADISIKIKNIDSEMVKIEIINRKVRPEYRYEVATKEIFPDRKGQYADLAGFIQYKEFSCSI